MTDVTELDLSWGVDEGGLARLVPDVGALRACVQDPVYHAEGDVWTHTLMVAESLGADPSFRALPSRRRVALSWAALLHDVEKPSTRTVVPDPAQGRDRISHPHHAPRGARTAWRHLWTLGAPLWLRQDVYGLVHGHQRPFHALSAPRWEEGIVRQSLLGRWDDLVLLALADNRGRIAPDLGAAEQALALAHVAAGEIGCLEGPYPFPSEQAAVRFARSRDATYLYDPPPPRGSTVYVLSGMPGVGKDTYARARFPDLPQVSLDAIREGMGVVHGQAEGQVAQAAFEEARVHLRARRPFVWNATNLTRLARDKVVGLALDYDARVEIHALEAPYATVMARNGKRRDAVPAAAMERFVEKWEPPHPGEAHAVVHVDTAEEPRPAPLPAA